MKIHDLKELAAVANPKPTAPARSRETRDKLERTGEAVLTKARASSGGQRAAHLAALRAAVESGTLKPDPQRIAQRLLTAAEVDAQLRALLID